MSIKQIIKYIAIALVVFFCIGFYHNHIADTPQNNQQMIENQTSHRTANQNTADWYNNGPQPLHPIQRIEYNIKSGFYTIL